MFGNQSPSSLETTHPRILRFYQDHPQLDFEMVNLTVIDLFEKTLLDTATTITTTDAPLHTKLVQMMQSHTHRMDEMNHSLTNIQESVSMIHSDITTHLWNKFVEIKQKYLEEFHVIVNSTTKSTIGNLLEQANQQLIDKTVSILQDAIPKGQNPYNEPIQSSIRLFQQTMTEETQSLMKSIHSMGNNNERIHEFIDNFELKSKQMLQGLQQPICAYIASSEERIHSNLSNLKDLSIRAQHHQEKSSKEWGDFIQKQQPSASATTTTTTTNGRSSDHYPGMGGPSSTIHRTQIQILLNRMYPTSEVTKVAKNLLLSSSSSSSSLTINTAATPLSSQIYSMKRPGSPTILVESKQCDANVDAQDIVQFVELMKSQHMNGIILSQNSGFHAKPNYYIELHEKYILVYVHQMEYNPDKLRPAVDIIDQMSTRIKQYNAIVNHGGNGGEDTDTATEWIERGILDDINNEYQLFISQKNAIIQNLRESQRKVISQIEEFQFPSLDKYLSSKYTAPMPKNGHKCELCKNFNANNLKALAAHKRGCMRKLGNTGTKNYVMAPIHSIYGGGDIDMAALCDVSLTNMVIAP
jgi:hypothetical protein